MDKFKPLYMAINEMMCEIGATGQIDIENPLVNAVMNELYELDGGVHDAEKVFGKAERTDTQDA